MDQRTNGVIGHQKDVERSPYNSVEHQTFKNPLIFKDFMNVKILLPIPNFSAENVNGPSLTQNSKFV